MYFPILKLTGEGRKIVSGAIGQHEKIVFTRAVIGSGTSTKYRNDIPAVTKLTKQELSLPLAASDFNSSTGMVTLSFNLDNSAITSAFQCTEMGIMAKLGDAGAEKLYAYTTSTEDPDTLRPYTDSGNVVTTFNVLITVGNATSISANLSESTGYVSYGMYRDHVAAKNPHGTSIDDLNVQWNLVKVGYDIPEALTRVEADEDIKSVIGKSAKAVNDLLYHLTDQNPHEGLGQMVFGTYVGNGEPYQDIDLGFQPRALLVIGASGNMHDDVTGMMGGLAFPGHPVVGRGYESAQNVADIDSANWDNVYYNLRIKIMGNGFRVRGTSRSGGSASDAGSNISGYEYRYIAFK